VLGVLLTLLIGGACAASSNANALTTKSEDVMAPLLNMVLMPVLLLSGILLPMNISDEWLEKVSDVIPVKHIVNAVRDTFAGDLGSSTVAWGSFWAVLLAALAMVWGTRVFRRENA
jgi:ABC-2 type transport system permease protein